MKTQRTFRPTEFVTSTHALAFVLCTLGAAAWLSACKPDKKSEAKPDMAIPVDLASPSTCATSLATLDCTALCDNLPNLGAACNIAPFERDECINMMCPQIKATAGPREIAYYGCLQSEPTCSATNACVARCVGPVPDMASPVTPTPDMAMAAADMVVTPTHKRVFVTKAGFNGNLGGLTGADQKCQSAATAAGLGGTYAAWMSSSTTNALTRIGDVGPWYLVDGATKVFDSKAAIASGPLVAIDMYEDKTRVATTIETWVGTDNTGVVYKDNDGAPVTCADWTDGSDTSSGSMGHVQASLASDWTGGGTGRCDQAASLYCFEQ